MFPESFVEKHLAASRYSGVVFDPFCGRGTTLFESLLRERNAAGCDIHPVAACVTGAKCNPPGYDELFSRLDQLQSSFSISETKNIPAALSEFFLLCFHSETLNQILYLRSSLNWQDNRTDRFLAALCLGALHGESHRSPNYFSNRMPRTISTKPGYSIRWWQKHGYKPPHRDVFEILRRMVGYRFRTPPPTRRAIVALADARNASKEFIELSGRVTDVITSPPYLDTTNYREDQWLRLWFLGGLATTSYSREDHRHYNKKSYWSFLEQAWSGVAPLLAREARFVIRIGGRRLEKNEMLSSLQETLTHGLGRTVRTMDHGVTTPVKRTQANSFRGSKASPAVEHDFCFIVS